MEIPNMAIDSQTVSTCSRIPASQGFVTIGFSFRLVVLNMHQQCISSLDWILFIISDKVLEEWRNEGTVSNLLWNHVRALMLKKHKHQHVSSKYVKRHTSKAKLNESKHKLSPVREISESVSAPNLHGYANGNFY